MRGVEITKQVKLSLTAENWELYTVSMDRCEAVARRINETIEHAFNGGASYCETHSAAWKIMKVYQDWGATDSEPMWKLDQLLDLLYDKER